MPSETYKEFLKEVLVTEEDLRKRVAELGQQISADYAGEELLLVCVLRGGVMFLTDLMR
jgi:hypoxanthine phosphoribosyltransferase